MDYSQYPNTRSEAKATGAKFYFTGEPCKYGHVALRKTKGTCLECLKNEWREGNEKRADYFRSYNQSDAGKKAKKAYYARNKDSVIARAQARTDEEKRRYKLTHKINNPDMYKELVNVRRKRFRQATPKWLSAEQKMEIRLKYRLAIELSKETGIRHAVDHIIPLMGEAVCGLHVPWNLTVITQEENLKKYNKLLDTTQKQA
jgi:5-methylcytosine-specific restriction endonuclease McrA